MGKVYFGPKQSTASVYIPPTPVEVDARYQITQGPVQDDFHRLNQNTYINRTPHTLDAHQPVQIQQVEVIKYVDRVVEVPIEKIVNQEVIKYINVPEYIHVEKIIEIPVEKIITKEIEIIKEVVKEIEKPIEIIKYMDRIVHRFKVPSWCLLAIAAEFVVIVTLLIK